MDLLNILASDRKIIGFRPEIKRAIKSTNATILLQQIIYWYTINDTKPFYKFIEPCEHPKYKDGDSWSEELALSKKEFATALKILVNLELVTAKINNSRVTYYDLEVPNIAKLLKGIYLSDQTALTKVTDGNLVYSKTMLPTETTTKTTTSKKNKTSFPEDDKDLCEHSILRALENGVNCPIQTYESFKDHHKAAGSKFVNWQSAFNTWARNFFKYNTPNLHERICLKDANNIVGFYNAGREEFKQDGTGKLFRIERNMFIQKILDKNIIVSGSVNA